MPVGALRIPRRRPEAPQLVEFPTQLVTLTTDVGTPVLGLNCLVPPLVPLPTGEVTVLGHLRVRLLRRFELRLQPLNVRRRPFDEAPVLGPSDADKVEPTDLNLYGSLVHFFPHFGPRRAAGTAGG